jgi:hypothetical protein
MMTMVRNRSDLQKAYGTLHYRKIAYAELGLLCLPKSCLANHCPNLFVH